jgi:hypothetical protein
MPASTRHHRTVAVFVHCIGVLAALPALPAATPEPTPTPAAPPPLGTPSQVEPTQGAPTPVTVAVASAGTPAPGYRIQVRNQGGQPVDTTVRQELPAGTRATWVTPGGRTAPTDGRGDATEVTWRLRLPAGSTTTLHTALTAAASGRPLAAPACAFTSDGNRPYDCATATWSRPAASPAQAETPWWHRPPVLFGALAVVLLLTIGGLWLWHRRRRAALPRAAAAGPSPDPAAAGRGTVYGPGATPPGPARRRRPPVWLVVGGAATVLAGVVLAAALTATRQVVAMDVSSQPTGGAWTGPSASGELGVPLREAAFEFTVYRVACPSASAGRRRCQATVGVRNLSPQQQTWHGQMQRAYLPGGTWVSTDEQATRLANQGRDVFAQPLAAGARMVLPLVFTLDGTAQPKQLELRSGVFSAGVRVDVS